MESKFKVSDIVIIKKSKRVMKIGSVVSSTKTKVKYFYNGCDMNSITIFIQVPEDDLAPIGDIGKALYE